MQLRMMLGFEMAERDFRSSITQDALMAVITAMADVPARKSMVLLSEGLDQGPSLRGQLQDVINAANRANVAIYTIDAAGLRAVSPLVGPGNVLNAAAAGGMSLAGVESRRDDADVDPRGLAGPSRARHRRRVHGKHQRPRAHLHPRLRGHGQSLRAHVRVDQHDV